MDYFNLKINKNIVLNTRFSLVLKQNQNVLDVLNKNTEPAVLNHITTLVIAYSCVFLSKAVSIAR